MIKLFLLCLILCSINIIYAQDFADTRFAEKKVKESTLIFEGKVILVDTIKKEGGIAQNINYVLVSKKFKGNFISDTVKIYSASVLPGWDVEDIRESFLGLSQEGVFFCSTMRPESVKQLGIDVYRLVGDYGFVSIKTYPHYPERLHNLRKIDYAAEIEKVKRTLYDSIELFTGQKYTQVRLNFLEEKNIAK